MTFFRFIEQCTGVKLRWYQKLLIAIVNPYNLWYYNKRMVELNKSRRAILYEASRHIDRSHSLIETVLREEQNALDNVPENLRESERFSAMEDKVDLIEDALDGLGDVKDILSEASS